MAQMDMMSDVISPVLVFVVTAYLAWKNAKSEEAYKSILTSAFTTWSSNQGTPFIEIFTSLLSTS